MSSAIQAVTYGDVFGMLLCTKDVNFWGSVYPTYYALPHLKASRGKLIVSSSIAATAPTSRLSLYNVSNRETINTLVA